MHVVYAWVVCGERGIERGGYAVYVVNFLSRMHSRVHHVHLRDFCFLPMLLFFLRSVDLIIHNVGWVVGWSEGVCGSENNKN